MDATDRQIIQILQQDARISMRELGRRVSLSNTAAAERVKKLEDAGVILGYQAVVDTEKLGYPVHAFIILTLTQPARMRPEAFLKEANQHPAIHQVQPILTGGVDYLLELYCQHMQEVNQIQQLLYPYGMTTTYLADKDLLPSSESEA